MDSGDRAEKAGVALSMVLAATDAGRAELAHPEAGLSLSQRKLLSKIDGQRRLADLVGSEAAMTAERIARDALRLLTLGLAHSDGFVSTRPASAQTQAAVQPAHDARAAGETQGRRGRSMRVWAGGAVALVALAVAAVLLRPSPAPVRDTAATAAQPGASTAMVPPTAAGTARPPSATEAAAPVAVERPAAAEAPARTFEPRAVNVPPKPEAPPARPQDNRSLAKSAAIGAVAQKPVAAAPAKPDPPASKIEPNRTAPSSTPAPQAAPVVAPVAASAPPVAPPAAAATPPIAAVAAPAPAPAPRSLLPNERDFAPASSDPEQLAQQATGRAPVQRTPPIYPRDAIRQGITEGSVRARLTIAADGTVERVETGVTDPRHAVFERPARAALMTWVFVPGAAGRVHETVLNFRAP